MSEPTHQPAAHPWRNLAVGFVIGAIGFVVIAGALYLLGVPTEVAVVVAFVACISASIVSALRSGRRRAT